jgi:hypothetical protein
MLGQHRVPVEDGEQPGTNVAEMEGDRQWSPSYALGTRFPQYTMRRFLRIPPGT